MNFMTLHLTNSGPFSFTEYFENNGTRYYKLLAKISKETASKIEENDDGFIYFGSESTWLII